MKSCFENGRAGRVSLAFAVLFCTSIASILPSQGQAPAPKRPAPTEQNAGEQRETSPPASALTRELGDTVALLPWTYHNGKEAALQSAREACNQVLLETGFNVFLIKSLTGSMPAAMPNNSKKTTSPFASLLNDGRALVGQTVTGQPEASYILPTVDEMIAIGDKLRTRYVLAGRAQWSTRNVWVGVSYRVKSICTVDMLILDTAARRLVLDARNIQGDSTENKNMYNTVSNVLTLNPLPLMLPGSVTPQEQRAVTVATAKAIDPWLKTQRIHSALAQADLSSELAETSESTEKFSTLLSPIADLQATLHVTELDEKQFAGLDAEMARLFSERTVALDFKEPNKLRLSAASPKQGQITLVLNEDERQFSTGTKNKGATRDVSGSPVRRLSLLDVCGLLSPGMFDTMRARFVREERVEDIRTLVYDLTYWGADDVSYQRIWISPTTRAVVKRDIFDRNSKLKAAYIYEQPVEIAPGTWLPTRVHIQNGQRKTLTVFSIKDAKIDRKIQDDVFSVAKEK